MPTSPHDIDCQGALQFSEVMLAETTADNTLSAQGLGTPACVVWGRINVAEGTAQVKVIGLGGRGQDFANHLVHCDPRFFDSSKELNSFAALQTATQGTHLLFVAVDPEIHHDLNIANEIAQSAETLGNQYVTLVCVGKPTYLWETAFRSRILLTDTTALESFCRVTCGIAWVANNPGQVGIDIEDIKTSLTACGPDSRVGLGCSNGSERAVGATLQALSTLQNQGVILSASVGVVVMLAGSNLRLPECKAAMNLIRQRTSQDAEVIYGTYLSDSFGDDLHVTVIAGSRTLQM
jgi:cell division GTPase FtsZ